jgi:membrane fusion protein (multidrug efflux system)
VSNESEPAKGGSPAGPPSDSPAADSTPTPATAPAQTPGAAAGGEPVFQPIRSGLSRRRIRIGAAIVVLAIALYFGVPLLLRALNTVSTDDAYVNGHVTFVAPRVPGQVARVFVDDNNRVAKGTLLIQLDKEPYQVQLRLKQAYVDAAKADLVVAQDQARAIVAQARGARYKLQNAIESVNNQIALLRATVATYESQKATLELARQDLDRAEKLVPKGAMSKEEFDRRTQQFKVGEAGLRKALEDVYQIRAGLGLPAIPENPDDPAQVPPDLNQTFSSVRQALAQMLQAVAPLGVYPSSYDLSPQQIIDEFYKRDPEGNLDRIYAKILQDAPTIKQAGAKLEEAERDLDQAELNLRYCDVFAEIDGAVTRRNVNPGNNVQAGQGLMAIRSLREIWIDANFKETQLANLRIGQHVDLEVDMYGRHRKFNGRVTGFTMGTGSTLSVIPPQNATGNFIKVVQRLPVRIELTEPNPEDDPLFVGLSVVPYVDVKQPPTGPDAGKFLQPYVTVPGQRPVEPAGAGP